jgi:hypothetical protein
MAFVHGRLTDFLLNQYDLTRYFKMLRTKGDVELLDGTTFGAAAKEFAGGFRGGEVSGEGLFLATAALVADADQVLDAALGAAVQPIGTLGFAGLDTLGNACKLFQGDEQQKDVNSSIQDLVMISAQFLASEGIRHGVVLAPIASYSATGDGASVDNAAASLNGAVAHLHVTTETGTTPTIDWKVQHSTDNAVWVDLITFAQATGLTSERKTVTGTINRYLRAIRTVAGTDSPAFTCALAIARL